MAEETEKQMHYHVDLREKIEMFLSWKAMFFDFTPHWFASALKYWYGVAVNTDWM